MSLILINAIHSLLILEINIQFISFALFSKIFLVSNLIGPLFSEVKILHSIESLLDEFLFP